MLGRGPRFLGHSLAWKMGDFHGEKPSEMVIEQPINYQNSD